MALARLALKNLGQRVISASPSAETGLMSSTKNQRLWSSQLLRRLSSEAAAGDEKSKGRDVTVSEGGDKKFRLFPKRHRKRGLWRNDSRDFVPVLSEIFPSGLGNALVQATENINRVLENLAPSRLIGRVKEQDECYKLRYVVPGLGKDDVKITVEDGILTIKGERKEEEQESDDDEYWSSASYGYYHTSLVLPEDAKADDIKAEMKDGVLTVTIPRTERPKKDVKEIQIH